MSGESESLMVILERSTDRDLQGRELLLQMSMLKSAPLTPQAFLNSSLLQCLEEVIQLLWCSVEGRQLPITQRPRQTGIY